ncbi:Factor arrest protein 11 [Orbilia oligospora]|uniref:Factor arrest protein 11 n=1 Tax=Orbilia oligospora TaxID=2813651 RepID=A0A7C8NT36_ORBOL|nr:Factor arrest protein 11 [Orbilia oligospora]KAF3106041.1 Factor arrest protein 11 [Orbilia oligospora]KAF3107288.1 Factor arrest protein 11 [Orbilia oligospora]KAF3134239.1 Factor arrest protein 11 [Orbilia oligospora]KAF3139610.1 Factor arrest protein 11 [Orbilia oligospora]
MTSIPDGEEKEASKETSGAQPVTVDEPFPDSSAIDDEVIDLSPGIDIEPDAEPRLGAKRGAKLSIPFGPSQTPSQTQSQTQSQPQNQNQRTKSGLEMAFEKGLRIDTAITDREGDNGFAPDSLSLSQLKKLVTEMPKQKQIEYAFKYSDTDTLQNEIEEWFPYIETDRQLVLACKRQFQRIYTEVPWTRSSATRKKKCLNRLVEYIESSSQDQRIEALLSVCYVAQGVYGETRSIDHQIHWIKENCKLIRQTSILDPLWSLIRMRISKEWEDREPSDDDMPRQVDRRELRLCLTILYLLLETGRDDERFCEEVAGLEPNITLFIVENVAKLRWEDAPGVPLQSFLLLLWKILLCILGTAEQLKKTKMLRILLTEGANDNGPPTTKGQPALLPKKMVQSKRDTPPSDVDEVIRSINVTLPADATISPYSKITASPLDYHNFRQELLHKYPAYNAPAVPNFVTKSLVASPNGELGFPTVFTSASTTPSILNQPVHIATPAPSPPPSPVAGKGGKKHNYQTNNNFPFLYPPTALGGWKDGWANMNSSDVGVPTSIREGGDLFRSRVRVSPALQQLAEEKERFLKSERGWSAADCELKSDQEKIRAASDVCRDKQNEIQVLERVDALYRDILPFLQSFVIVLLKITLSNMSITNPPVPQNGSNVSDKKDEDPNNVGILGDALELDGVAFMSMEELDKLRNKEIMSKVTGALFLSLLKWFRVSHVLKFEYLSQLLLDSNFLPLMLKIYSQQEVTAAVALISDKKDFSYFQFCSKNSARQYTAPAPPPRPRGQSDSSDDAVPPPIMRIRRINTEPEPPILVKPDSNGEEPTIITEFSWRNFFTTVNFLRVMQKVCKGKPHRNLMLVQYKSSTILRKPLKVPQDEMRLYTLKLFKGQVPFCGRKWRQSNMRVITSIYLYCRPELRDDWLAASDIDIEVEEAMPQEQALRGLIHFYNLQHYPQPMTLMGFDPNLLAEERNFFTRELEKIDWGPSSLENDAEGEEMVWDGPPLFQPS